MYGPQSAGFRGNSSIFCRRDTRVSYGRQHRNDDTDILPRRDSVQQYDGFTGRVCNHCWRILFRRIPRVPYAIAVNAEGYCLTHHFECSKAPKGNYAAGA
jgi:hypothetical protein